MTAPGNHPPYVRKPKGDSDLDALIAIAVRDAVEYIDTELGPERAVATEYYKGVNCGSPAEEGRSKAILPEVRDNIKGVIPSILRVVHGPEHVVEFVPKRQDQVDAAEQATDYVRFVFEDDNKGFLLTHSTLKDGLLKKLGVLKWGMDEVPEVHTTMYRGLTREDLTVLAEREGVEISVTVEHPDGSFDVEAQETEMVGKSWVLPIPPDDFFWNRDARSIEDAIIVGHRTRPTWGDLRKMGVSEDDLEEYGGGNVENQQTPEEQARRDGNADPSAPLGDEHRRALCCEVYMVLQMPGKKVPELRRIRTLGEGYHAIKNEPANERPFVMFCPDPEPHAFLGDSWYDMLKDTQKINSQLLRGMLDQLSTSLFPRPIYVDGQVSIADLMNNAIGAPVRERAPGMVRYDMVPFAGEKVMPVMDLMRGVVERRTGQKDGAGSLDMDALQSTDKDAAQAAILSAQAVPELLTRLYAEQVLKPLFKGLYKLSCNPKSKARIIRLRGQYVEVNPATWDASMDVTVNVALGSMDTAKKMAVLDGVIADQTSIIAEMGPANPMVTVPMLRNAKAKRLSLSGIKDVDRYYKPMDPNWQPPPPPPPEPSEDEKWRQAEAKMAFEKSMKELAIAQDKLALEAQKHEDDIRVREAELAIKREATEHGPHNAEIERYKAELDAANTREEILSRERIEAAKLELEREKMVLDAQTKMAIADKQAEAAKEAAKMKPTTSESGD